MPGKTMDDHIRIFLCYRDKDAETAKNVWLAMKESTGLNFGNVWYSDGEPVGNFHNDIHRMVSGAEYAVLFISKGFTAGFLKDDGRINEGCTTAFEMIEIERRRQAGTLKVCSINIDNYCLDDAELAKIHNLFKKAGILKNDSISAYKALNRNEYSRRQTTPKVFVENRLRSLALFKNTSFIPPIQNNSYYSSNRLIGSGSTAGTNNAVTGDSSKGLIQKPKRVADYSKVAVGTDYIWFNENSFEDPLLLHAVHVVMETGYVSNTDIQKRLRVGKSRAEELIKLMEQKGMISTQDRTGQRKVLVDKDGFSMLLREK